MVYIEFQVSQSYKVRPRLKTENSRLTGKASMLLKVTFHLYSWAPLMKFNHKSNQTGTHVEVGRGQLASRRSQRRSLGVDLFTRAGEVAQLLRAMVALPEDLVLLPILRGCLVTVCNPSSRRPESSSDLCKPQAGTWYI